MSQFPTTIKAITFSKTGEVDVIEKTEIPFPRQGPKDVILKVDGIITMLGLRCANLPVSFTLPALVNVG